MSCHRRFAVFIYYFVPFNASNYPNHAIIGLIPVLHTTGYAITRYAA